LNIFVLEKPFENINASNDASKDELIKQTINKLGFYPEVLLEKYKNAKLFVSNLADGCLINEIYNRIFSNEHFNNIVHMHFDTYKAQLSMFMEGVINDKISGLTYEAEKGLIDNLDNVTEFVNKIINIFGMLDISLSFSGFDDK